MMMMMRRTVEWGCLGDAVDYGRQGPLFVFFFFFFYFVGGGGVVFTKVWAAYAPILRR